MDFEFLRPAIPYMAMIATFLIYFHFYNLKKQNHKDFDEITNFDLEDETIYDPYYAHDKADLREEYVDTYYYKYGRKYALQLQTFLKNFINVKYLEMVDELLEQSGRKYNMKAIEFISMALIVFGGVTIVAKIFLPLNVSILAGLGAAYLFPVHDVIVEQRAIRKKLIKLELPSTLDFFYILMKAGNSFDESLKEIAYSNDTPLTQEFRRMIDEIENKKIPAVQAYMNSSKRVNLDSYANFIKAIQASQELGADIVKNIKEKSDDLKEEYMTEKEKQIEKLETKIVVPIVLCFMPPVVFGFFGPQIYEMLQMF